MCHNTGGNLDYICYWPIWNLKEGRDWEWEERKIRKGDRWLSSFVSGLIYDMIKNITTMKYNIHVNYVITITYVCEIPLYSTKHSPKN